MSDSHSYHWLVIHDKASITSLSLAIMQENLKKTGKPETEQGRIIEIIAKGGPKSPVSPTPLRVPNVSSGNTKVAISELQWPTADEAIAWSQTAEGKAFLRENHDAFLIAVPKAK